MERRIHSAIVLAVALLAGCGPARTPTGEPTTRPLADAPDPPAPPPTIYVAPAPPPRTDDTPPPVVSVARLSIDVTNSSTAAFWATVDTNDRHYEIGEVFPGETVTIELDDVPDWATVSAGATTRNHCGEYPDFDPVRLEAGLDYDDDHPGVWVEWFDPPRG
jgi:hypothetical protein